MEGQRKSNFLDLFFEFRYKKYTISYSRVNLGYSSIFLLHVFLGFGYKIIEKPQISSDNLGPASTVSECGTGFDGLPVVHLPIGLFHFGPIKVTLSFCYLDPRCFGLP